MRIGLYQTSSAGVSRIQAILSPRYEVTMLTKTDVEAGLSAYDLLIMPGGYDHLFQYLTNATFRRSLLQFCQTGAYLGICGGMLLAGFMQLGQVQLGFIPLVFHYLYYHLFHRQGKVILTWCADNEFHQTGDGPWTWVAGPYVTNLGLLQAQAHYRNNHLYVPLQGKPAIVLGSGVSHQKICLLGVHPEYPCDGIDHSDILVKAVHWLETSA